MNGDEHPEPPGGLDRLKPLMVCLEAGTRVYRIHAADKDALHFGRTGRNRFDDPGAGYGVLYAGADEHCAFIETFGQETGSPAVSGALLESRELSILALGRALHLIDLAGANSLGRIRADSRLMSGPHAVAQRWSAALHAHPFRADGLRYQARHDPGRFAYAFFERAANGFGEVMGMGSLLETRNAELLGRILDDYDFGIV